MHKTWLLSLSTLSLLIFGGMNVMAAAPSEKSNYIPKPVPAKSDIDIAAFYYPGTEQMEEWDMVRESLPHIKPLLGWYDEGNPEVIDWQIKWAVEHGIKTFFVDWYWNQGRQRLDHWVKGYYKAQFRGYLKWAMMWANHNQPGAHNEADQIRVTQFWLDNYFKTPEYYKVDGKPVVLIWDAANLDRDFIAEAKQNGVELKSGEGLKKALKLSDDMVRKAGLPGIYFISMNTPFKKDKLEYLAKAGFESTTNYDYSVQAFYLSKKKDPKDTPKYYDYGVTVETIEQWYQKRFDLGTLPFIPTIPTGWNDIPRSYEKSRVVYGRTVEKWRANLEIMKKFCEKNKIKQVVIAPVNEWQEGSYIEPNEEFGFAMYDTLRDVFCRRPEQGWPKNLTPKDLGRGPYDYPEIKRLARTEWDFNDSTQGWYRQPYGGGTIWAKDGCLNLDKTRNDRSAIRIKFADVDTARYDAVKVRMRLTKPQGLLQVWEKQGVKQEARLRWSTDQWPIVKDLVVQQENSVAIPVQVDGQFHEYTFPLKGNSRWTGKAYEFWLDPIGMVHTKIEIDFIKMVPGR